MPTARRLASIALVYLAIGAAITIAISWSVAAWCSMRETRRDTNWKHFTLPSVLACSETYGGFGWTRRGWEPVQMMGRPPSHLMQWTDVSPSPVSFSAAFANKVAPPEPWPPWGTLESQWRSASMTTWVGCEHATGWPFRALWYQLDFSKGGVVSAAGGIPLHEPIGLNNAPFGAVRALPYRPVWLGLALDSVIWGLAAWALLGRVWMTQQALRLRRNHCPRCNYDLSASPTTCPECGWNRPAPTAITPQSAQLADPPS